MKTYSTSVPEVYQVIGSDLLIHWNIEEQVKPGIGGETTSQWVANEAVCSKLDNRSTLISKIIRSDYSIDEEFAIINNQFNKPIEYQAYQDFRTLAKALADAWLVSVGQHD